eukprot:521095-Karenia_brevis.AAC.1
MAALLLSTCGQYKVDDFFQSQARVIIVDGREIYRCMPCFVAHDNKEPTKTQWKKIVGQSKGRAYFVAEYAADKRKNGGKGQQ